MRLTYAAATHVGVVRSENQDALVIDGWVAQAQELERRGEARLHGAATWSAAVLDGMGGYAGGATASLIGARALAQALAAVTPASGEGAVAAAYRSASDAITTLAAAAPELNRMGTTATAVVLGANQFAVSNVGDARAYRLWRGTYFSQLTIDDRISPANHAITQALGPALRGQPDPHHLVVAIDASTVLLLCSDGLTDYLTDDSIRAVLIEKTDPSDAARTLIEKTLDAGAPDNTTVVVIVLDPTSEDQP